MPFHQITTLNCKGRLLDLQQPIVMGILNLTPDSFFDGGKYKNLDLAIQQAETMLSQGTTIIDVGGQSTRPNAVMISEKEEYDRVVPVLKELTKRFPSAFFSVDTFRSSVARGAVEEAGASIINDVSAGDWDEAFLPTVADLQVPYILMHKKENTTPETMQQNPLYEDVMSEITIFFIQKIKTLRDLGVYDIVLDVGFGFGKTVEHNYHILKNMGMLSFLEYPILAGLSRKSMIYKPLEINAENALNGTTALNMVALQQGARILRVHDVKAAVETIKLWQLLAVG